MPANSWHEFTITCPVEMREPLSGVLFGLGCTGITDEGDSLKAYFPSGTDRDAVAAAISGLEGVSYTDSIVEEQDWYAGWKRTIGPYRAAGFLIYPPWKLGECAPGPGEKLMVLDPGQAFGTGNHESTISMLEMLGEWVGAQGDPSSRRLLDLGTGTGILSMAAVMHGIGDVTAVDVEPKAVESAARNFALNRMVGRIRLMPGSLAGAGGGYDLIIANLFQEVLLELMPGFAPSLNPGGELFLSGLLAGQDGSVVRAAESHGLELKQRRTIGDWVSLRLSVRAPRGHL